MKKLLLAVFFVTALILWGCDDGVKTLGDGEGVILIEERSLTEEEIEEECPNGGVKIVTGFDKNGNGVLDEDEIYDTYFVCHGEDGKDGIDGVDGKDGDKGEKGDKGDPGEKGEAGEAGEAGEKGEDGTSTLTKVVPIEKSDEGHECENGGYWVITCENDGDGECVEDTETIEAVCHGVEGEKGEKGEKGDEGTPGSDGVCAGNVFPEINITFDDNNGNPYFLGISYDLKIEVAGEKDINVKFVGSGLSFEGELPDFKVTPQMYGGPYNFAVILSDGCEIVLESIEISKVIDPYYFVKFDASAYSWTRFPQMPGVFAAVSDWTIIEKVMIPEDSSGAYGWHFFRGSAWQDKEGDVALSIKPETSDGAEDGDLHAWLRKGGWVNTRNDNLSIKKGVWYTVAYMFDSTAQKTMLYLDGVKVAETAVSFSAINDAANTNVLTFGGQYCTGSGSCNNDLYTEADIAIMHHAWLGRLMSEEELLNYDGTISYLENPEVIFNALITESSMIDTVSEEEGLNSPEGTSPEFYMFK